MDVSPSTAELLATLDAYSGNRLKRKEDLAILLEIGTSPPLDATLDEVSFYAKFLDRAHRIMERIGMQGEGYDRLSREFSASLEKTVGLIRIILQSATPESRNRFENMYLSMTHDSLGNFLALCSDLGWYKNFRLDAHGRREKGS
jgi:hypothetical protein